MASYGGTGGFRLSNHEHEFVMKNDANISAGNGSLFESGIDRYLSDDVDVITIHGANDFSNATSGAIEEAVFLNGKILSIGFPSDERFNRSLPATKIGMNTYGAGLNSPDPGHPIMRGLPQSYTNAGSALQERKQVEPKDNSTVLIQYDNDDKPALVVWQYGAGYVIYHTMNNTECVYGNYNDGIFYRSIMWALSGRHSAYPPGIPLNTTAEGGDRKVFLQWMPPSDTGGLPMAEYNIYSGLGKYNLTFLDSTIGINYTHGGLVNGQTYYYRINSATFAGENVSSPLVNATPLGVPSGPMEFHLMGGDGEVRLHWSGPLFTGGTNISGYNIYRGMDEGNLSFLAQTPGNVNTYNDASVGNGLTYFYSIRALNPLWEGESTEVLYATPAGLPDPPRNLNVHPYRDRIFLNWNPPGHNGGEPITGYKIYRGNDLEDQDYLTTVGIETNYSDKKDISMGTRYYYRISAVNDNGEGNLSNLVNTTPLAPPGGPVGFTWEGGDGWIALSWNNPNDDGGTPVVRFLLHKFSPGGGNESISIPAAQLSYLDQNVVNGMPYRYRVSAVNLVGEGETSEEYNATPMGLPFPPEKINITLVNGSVWINWSQPRFDGGSPVTKYYVYRGRMPHEMLIIATITEGRDFLDDGISEEGIYFYRIVAVTGMGESPVDVIREIMIARVSTKPLTFRVSANDAGTEVKWEPPGDTGGAPVTDYSLYRRTESGLPILIARIDGTSYNDKNVKDGEKYFYSICANNAMGEGVPSEEVPVTIGSGGDTGRSSDGVMEDLSEPWFVAIGFILLLILVILLVKYIFYKESDEAIQSEDAEEVELEEHDTLTKSLYGTMKTSSGPEGEDPEIDDGTMRSSKHSSPGGRVGMDEGAFFMATGEEKMAEPEPESSGPVMGPKLVIEELPEEEGDIAWAPAEVLPPEPPKEEEVKTLPERISSYRTDEPASTPLPSTPPRLPPVPPPPSAYLPTPGVPEIIPGRPEEAEPIQPAPQSKGSDYKNMLENIVKRSREIRKHPPSAAVPESAKKVETFSPKDNATTKKRRCGICLEGFDRPREMVTCPCETDYHRLCAIQVYQCPRCDRDLLELAEKGMDRGEVDDFSFIWGK